MSRKYVNIEICLYEPGYDVIDLLNFTTTVALTRHLFKGLRTLNEAKNEARRLDTKKTINLPAKPRSLIRSRPRNYC